MKAWRVLLLILGIMLVISGLAAVLASPVGGIIGIGIGVFAIVYSRKGQERIRVFHTYIAGISHHKTNFYSLDLDSDDHVLTLEEEPTQVLTHALDC